MDDALLHEPSHRRPEWSESRGEWVVLGDGQKWLIPKPLVRLRPIVENGRFARSEAAFNLGDEFEAAVESIRAIDPADTIAVTDGMLRLAVIMLHHHYELPDDAYGDLLDVGRIDYSTLMEFARIALGQAPKPLPAGEG